MNDYIGIDYGRGVTNIDIKTGIRYGVIHSHEVLQAWADESEGDYGMPSCPECGGPVVDYDDDIHSEYVVDERTCADYACEYCEQLYSSKYVYPEEAISFTYEADGYQAEQGGDGHDIFITKSHYYTTCQFCSPCAPGAGYIMNTVKDGIRAYCFGHDWFESGKAPYPVYDVKTNKEV